MALRFAESAEEAYSPTRSRWGERPIAVIRFTGATPPTLAAINAPISAAMARGERSRYALLDRFELVETTPRTSVGKVDKKLLRERLASHGAAQWTPVDRQAP
jgi:non-ribosomal peptide synthetase component E (peptide arylation enzyme)